MKKILTTITLAALTLAAQAQVPAFPGAEGHGRYTTGGRAADGTTKVYHVTNLNDSGTGSLRWALSQAGPRTIVFDVGGYIDLKSQLNISGNTTIAGQTAPYPGITLRYYTLYLNGSNVIIRYIRSRRSQVKDIDDGADATWGRQKSNVIFDHCSFSWSIDEVASFYDNNCFTMQWCTIAESLTNPGHSKGAHGYGGIWGGKLASFHHNLIAHVTNRAPRFNGARYKWTGYTSNKYYSQYNWKNTVQAENVDFRNCLMYNYQSGSACYGGPGGGYINIVNNYYKAGPSASTNKNVTNVSLGSSGNSTPSDLTGMSSRYYINGNHVTAAGTKAANYDWSGVSYDGGTITVGSDRYSKDSNNMYGDSVTSTTSGGVKYVRIKLDSPAPTGEVTTHTALNTYEKVRQFAGSSLYRDAVDTRYMKEVEDGTATYTGPITGKKGQLDFINDPTSSTQNNAWPSYPDLESTSRPEGFDTDNDGIPDEWEIANNLNPNDASDAQLYTIDTEKKWYNNLEVYLSSLVEDIMRAGNADAETSVDEYYPKYQPTAIHTVKTATNGGNSYNLSGQRVSEGYRGLIIRGGKKLIQR